MTRAESGEKYTHLNTHLDHILEKARVQQAEVLSEKIAELKKLGTVVCTGDFNVFQDSDCYNTMVSGNMKDARKLASDTDDCLTYHGFRPDEVHDIIDFVFVDEATVKPVNFKVINKMVDGDFYSDHNAVYADVEI